MNQDTAHPTFAPLCEHIRAAASAHQPLRLRGGGSKDFYGQSLQGEVLSTTVLTGVTSYEPSELVITALAGTPLAQVEALLAAQGQYLPFEPPHFSWSTPSTSSKPSTPPSTATLGGMVASGLSGPARASAGSVRDHVLGVSLINGRAEPLSFGGQVIKNVAGYDVSRVMVGAMGTLGLLTSVSLKVLPLPPAEATLVFEMSQAEALAQLHRWGAQPLPLNASCWVKDASHPDQRPRELLFVRLRGAIAAVEAACAKMLSDAPAAAQASRMDSTQAATDWRLCRDQQLPFFSQPPIASPGEGMALWRISIAQTAPVLDLPWPQLVEWHGGLRWLWAPLSAAATVRELTSKASGSATLFVAKGVDGVSTTGPFGIFLPLPSPLDRIHRQLKAEFDPAGIFNLGRMYDSF